MPWQTAQCQASLLCSILLTVYVTRLFTAPFSSLLARPPLRAPKSPFRCCIFPKSCLSREADTQQESAKGGLRAAGDQRLYPFIGLLVAVGVERGQDVNPGLLHQADDARVPGQVLLAQELHEQKHQLPAQHLIAMGPCHVVELGFTLTQRWKSTGSDQMPVAKQPLSHCARQKKKQSLDNINLQYQSYLLFQMNLQNYIGTMLLLF